MGCDVAFDQYLIVLIRDQDLILKEIERASRFRPPQVDKLTRLSTLVHGLNLLEHDLQNNRDNFINSCKLQAKSEDYECELLYKNLKEYILNNRDQLNNEIMGTAINGVDIVEGTKYAIDRYLSRESEIDKFIKDCKNIQKVEK